MMQSSDSFLKSCALSFQGISKRFGHRQVLSELNLFVESGEFLTLLGPSGCGKTTILRLMAGLETPDSGRILLGNEDITFIPAEHRPIHTIFQRYALFPHMTVFQNVAFGLQMHDIQEPELTKRVMESLQWMQLEEFAYYPPNRLSGGQQQRVAIARAVVNRPKILLLDECLSALDYKLRRKIKNELKALQRHLNIPFVFVTHNQEEALSISDRIIVLKEGQIQQVGTPKEIYEDPANIFVANFIGDSNLFSAHILSVLNAQTVQAIIESYTFELSLGTYLKNHPELTVEDLIGGTLTVLLRPEDLRISDLQPEESAAGLVGYIKEQNYKGMTLDSVIELESGHIVLASEFFNEDDPEVEHALHQRVCVSWVPSWEVVLDP